jgi:hypothetical protein
MNAPALDEIRITLEKVVYDVLNPEGIEFSRKGFKFETKGLPVWARVHAQFGKTETLEHGVDAPLGIRNGLLLIQIFIVPNTDVSVGERVGALLEKAFRYKDFEGIYCDDPYTEAVGMDSDDSWYQFNVTIPFWTWVGK